MYRSIILAFAGLILAAPVAQTDDKPPAGFVALFDGKSLDGWQLVGSKKECWKADKGLLVCDGGGGGWLMSKKEYDDFELRLEYRLQKKGNSGVAIRSPLKGRPSAVGMEIQILDDPNYKGLKPSQHTGSLYGIVAASKHLGERAEKWNTMRIVCKGRKLLVEVNDTKLVDVNLDDYKKTHGKSHPGILRPKGHIGLQDHGGKLEFRKIFLMETTN